VWERATGPAPADDPSALPAVVPHAVVAPRADDGALRVTWVGHATFLLQVGPLNVLTDPVWSDRCSPVAWAGPTRRVAPGIAFDALPPIDLVLLSHDHYDHLDDATVRALARAHPAAWWCAPSGVGPLLAARGVERVSERDWWDVHVVGDATVTCVPAQHFSGRSAVGRDRTLWCGWTLAAHGWRCWFVGDTGFHPEFGTIGARAGPFDLVCMPIGAYAPRWFMAPVHVDPDEAVRAVVEATAAHRDAPTPAMAAMHWGTFRLTDEPLHEPPQRARAAWDAAGLPPDALWVMAPGETRVRRR
jgi:N-acyl-phosphatidylethanolamine-hydrolysing phospholipase D